METSETTLPQPTRAAALAARLQFWLSILPLWAIALILISPVIVFGFIPSGHLWFPYWLSAFRYFLLTYVVVFLPGALKRWSWRQALIMFVLAGFAYALTFIHVQNHLRYPYNRVSIIPLLIGYGEWLVNPPRQLHSLEQTLLLASGVALLGATLMPFTEWYFCYHYHTVEIEYYSFWLLTALFTWLAISFSSGGKKSLLPVLAISASVGWFLLFFLVIVRPLARRSLQHGLPLSRQYSLSLMRSFPDTADDKALWDTINSADWSIPDQNEPYDNDYRKRCIELLSQHNRPAAAASLSTLLRRKPSAALADFSSPILALEHRYETAPELMRYSLPFSGSEHATEALISMGIPQAALAILAEDAASRKMIENENETDSSLLEQQSSEAKLTHLLGKDVGNRWKAWEELYNSVIATRPTPLTLAQSDEVNRIVAATEKYWITTAALIHQHRFAEIAQPNVDVPGTSAFEQAINQFASTASLTPPTSLPFKK